MGVEAVSVMSDSCLALCQVEAGMIEEGKKVLAVSTGTTRHRKEGKDFLTLQWTWGEKEERASLLYICSQQWLDTQLLQFVMSPSWKTYFLIAECRSLSDGKCKLMEAQTVVAKLYGECMLLCALEPKE